MMHRLARRHQTFAILVGVLCELVAIVLGTAVILGPFIFDYVKKRVHEAVMEEATKQSIWHTMDYMFAYFGHKLASPVIMAGRGVVD